jgi:hypothetical protein
MWLVVRSVKNVACTALSCFCVAVSKYWRVQVPVCIKGWIMALSLPQLSAKPLVMRDTAHVSLPGVFCM